MLYDYSTNIGHKASKEEHFHNEAQIQSKIIKFLKSKGVFAVKVARSNLRGVPDILCCRKGHFLAFEVKHPATLKKGRSQLQKAKVEKIIEQGGFAFFVCSVEQVENIVNLLDNGNHKALQVLQEDSVRVVTRWSNKKVNTTEV